jgi:hypothetical protein
MRADLSPRPRGRSLSARTQQLAFFYLVPPLLLALPLGAYRAGLGLPLAHSLALWTIVCLVSWWLSEVFARVMVRALQPWAPPLWVSLTVGYLINLALSSWYVVPIVAAVVQVGALEQTPALTTFFTMERDLLDASYWFELLRSGAPSLALWLLANYLFERVTSVRRFAARAPVVTEAPQPNTAASLPASEVPVVAEPHEGKPANPLTLPAPHFFGRMTRLRNLRIEELLAVEAEDHYVQIYTSRGKELIYYRFKDVLDEVRHLDGAQIHRSAWVQRCAVERLEEKGRAASVVLKSGERLAVSFANRGLVRHALGGSSSEG